MIQLNALSMQPGHSPAQLKQAAAKALHLSPRDLEELTILKRSIDARKKPEIRLIYCVAVRVRKPEGAILVHCHQAALYTPVQYQIPHACSQNQHPVVVGFGPAGMFAALILAKAGLQPIVLERGLPADVRQKKVQQFWKSGQLDPECNVQFGEGGAGTFSDGKLNTGTHNLRIAWILQQFVAFGAPEEILYDAKPHIGTDILVKVVQNIRQEIIKLGGQVLFSAKLTGIAQKDGAVCGAIYNNETTVPCDTLILSIGHSARDTFRMLHQNGIVMEQKPFSMGVRIEHKQALIDAAQYGGAHKEKKLPPADYKLHAHFPDGSSAYTFCMCPGGYVVAAASMEGGVVTNGMSYSGRSGENANAALLVTLQPQDFPGNDPLAGVRWQEEIERRAFSYGGNNYHAPAQLVGDFLGGRASVQIGNVTPTYQPGIRLGDLHDVLPEKITAVLAQALPVFGTKIQGFSAPDAILTAPETRSSSPVRLLRNQTYQGSLPGLYPCGEGAGYAGGIMSAAVDGILCAEAAIQKAAF